MLYPDASGLVARLRWALTDDSGRRAAAALARKHIERYDWRHVAAPAVDRLVARLVTGVRSAGPG